MTGDSWNQEGCAACAASEHMPRLPAMMTCNRDLTSTKGPVTFSGHCVCACGADGSPELLRAPLHSASVGEGQSKNLFVSGFTGCVHAPMAQLPPMTRARLSSHRRGLEKRRQEALESAGRGLQKSWQERSSVTAQLEPRAGHVGRAGEAGKEICVGRLHTQWATPHIQTKPPAP